MIYRVGQKIGEWTVEKVYSDRARIVRSDGAVTTLYPEAKEEMQAVLCVMHGWVFLTISGGCSKCSPDDATYADAQG